MKATRKPFSLKLPPDILKAIAAKARRDKVTATDVVEAALRVYLGVYPSWVPKGGRNA